MENQLGHRVALKKIMRRWSAFFRTKRGNQLALRLANLEDSLEHFHKDRGIAALHDARLVSLACRRAHFDTDWYRRWMSEMTGSPSAPPFCKPAAHVIYHRKNWEWCAILEAAHQYDALTAGKCALGFAVGQEPLPSMFAKYGLQVLATDLAITDPRAESWQKANQHASHLEALWIPAIVAHQQFDQNVRFQSADMNDLSKFEPRGFDLVWSSCAMEHLGSLEQGLNFVYKSAELLRPGGVCLHTTEFNLSSLTDTVTQGPNVIYRRSDLRRAAETLATRGFRVAAFDFSQGALCEDLMPDLPPYYEMPSLQHVKVLIDGYVSTSILLIVERPARS